MEFEQILQLVEKVSTSSLESFSLEQEGTVLKMKMASKGGDAAPEVAGKMASKGGDAAPEVAGKMASKGGDTAPEVAGNMAGKGGDPAPACKVVESPLVGVFYAAPAEDAGAFVQVGDQVKKGQVLAIVEAMKLMNEIESPYDGLVKEICVENAQAVEYGQALFLIAQE